MKPLRLSALAVALLLAACTATPTDPARLDSATPSFNGGGSLGSGNNSGEESGDGSVTTEDGGNTLGSGNATSDSTGTGTGRGGNGLGSGN